MDIYLLLLAFGGIGLAAMGLLGLGAHGHGGGGHGHAGHGHVGNGHGHAGTHGASHATGQQHGSQSDVSILWQLMSPRIILAIAFGIGATGLALRPILGGVVLLGVALLGGLGVERLVVRPLWNLFMRFGSNPALTLESAVTSEATVVSSFDTRGQGLVSIEVDGQVVQLLASLRTEELASGARIRAGERVRVEEIDALRNRCTVTRL